MSARKSTLPPRRASRAVTLRRVAADTAASATLEALAPADDLPPDEPCYVISVAAQMVGMHAQTLRYYERLGLVEPGRSKGNIRLYRRSDIDRLRLIQRLMSELGVNLAGVGVILKLDARIRDLERRLDGVETLTAVPAAPAQAAAVIAPILSDSSSS